MAKRILLTLFYSAGALGNADIAHRFFTRHPNVADCMIFGTIAMSAAIWCIFLMLGQLWS